MKYLQLPFLFLALVFRLGCLLIANGLQRLAKKIRRRQVVARAAKRRERAREKAKCYLTPESVKLPHDEAQAFIEWLGGCVCGEATCPNRTKENPLSQMSDVEFEYEEKSK